MRRDNEQVEVVRGRFEQLESVLDERAKRRWAAAESLSIGYGGDAIVSAATGLARATIRRGRAELAEGGALSNRLRRPGGGRPRLVDKQPALMGALEALVSPLTRGDPESPLRWTLKSRSNLAAELQAQGFKVSSSVVGRLLKEMGYRLQAMSKTREGGDHDDRDAQFAYINGTVKEYHAAKCPVISVDTKKKELVGDFKNGGREWQPKEQPDEALVHDFPTQSIGKAIPYGIYDIGRNQGWVNVGMDHDTPAFAVASIAGWWKAVGRRSYPGASKLYITADGGGSNGYRPHAWKSELQKFATAVGLEIHISHFPPGTSKWNAIEHRLFSFISMNWRGRSLNTFETVVSLIRATKNKKGLRVRAVLDKGTYPRGLRPSAEETAALNITRSAWHGEWNYTIKPVAEGAT